MIRSLVILFLQNNASFAYMKLLLPSMMKSASIPPSGILDMPFSGTSALPPYTGETNTNKWGAKMADTGETASK